MCSTVTDRQEYETCSFDEITLDSEGEKCGMVVQTAPLERTI